MTETHHQEEEEVTLTRMILLGKVEAEEVCLEVVAVAKEVALAVASEAEEMAEEVAEEAGSEVGEIMEGVVLAVEEAALAGEIEVVTEVVTEVATVEEIEAALAEDQKVAMPSTTWVSGEETSLRM